MIDDDPLGAHPSSEQLAAYQANELSPEEDDSVQEHVAGCRLCAERLLELERYLGAVEEERGREGVEDFETAADWRRLRGRMGSPVRRFFGSVRTAYSLAAVLALAVAGLSWSLASLNKELRRPVADMGFETLEARGSRRAVGGKGRSLELPTVLALELPSAEEYPRYHVVFRDRRDQILRTLEETADQGVITLWLPEGSLEIGEYEIEVLAPKANVLESLAIFNLQISH